MMKRIVAVLFVLALLLLGAALVAPNFIDWNRHKDAIVAQFQDRLQRRLEVGGAVGFRILPQPRVMMENVAIGNAAGMEAEHVLTLGRLEARVAFIPLLNGEVEVKSVNLVNPVLTLETAQDGGRSWSGILKPQAAGAPGGFSASSVRLENVTVTGGTVRYMNRATGAAWEVEDLDLSISAGTLAGPYKITGGMEYRGVRAAVGVTTGRFAAGGTPVTLSFAPSGRLPRMDFDGTMETGGGFGLRGRLSVSGGAVADLADLADHAALEKLAFLRDEAEISAALEMTGGAVRLRDIAARFGKGTLSGSVSVDIARGQKPAVGADLSGENLVISPTGSTLLEIAADFEGPVTFSGKNITYYGVLLDSVDVAAQAGDGEWTVERARMALRGGDLVTLAGAAAPGAETAALGMRLETRDLGAFLDALPLAPRNALRLLAGAKGPVREAKLSGTLDLEPGKVALAALEGTIGGKTKISGDIRLDTDLQRPVARVKLDIAGLDMRAMDAEKVDGLLENIMLADAGLDLSFTGLVTRGGFSVPSLEVRATAEGGAFHIRKASAVFGEGEGLELSGRLGALSPPAHIDVTYAVHVRDGGAFAGAFGLPLPPPVKEWKAARLRGVVKGDASAYAFTADGHAGGSDISIDGTADAGVYDMALRVRRAEENAPPLGLPLENLLAGRGGGFEFSGRFRGKSGDYTISGIETTLAGARVKGDASYKAGALFARLAFDTIDLGQWRWGDWAAADDVSLSLSANALLWNGITVENPAFDLRAAGGTVEVSGFSGELWGGAATGGATARKKDKTWQYTLQAGVAGADLDYLSAAAGLPGISLGAGDVALDLSSEGPGFFTAREAAAGVIRVSASALGVAGFDPDAAAVAVAGLPGPVENLQQVVNHALKEKGDAAYGARDITVTLRDGRATVENMELEGENHRLEAGAVLDIAPGTYEFSGSIAPKAPADAPAIRIRRSDSLGRRGTYGADVTQVESWLARGGG